MPPVLTGAAQQSANKVKYVGHFRAAPSEQGIKINLGKYIQVMTRVCICVVDIFLDRIEILVFFENFSMPAHLKFTIHKTQVTLIRAHMACLNLKSTTDS
jgi:hypothetical protein